MKKRKIVLNDKAKIAAVIEELDQKKNEALTKAWEQVNKVWRDIVLICFSKKKNLGRILLLFCPSELISPKPLIRY
jgi:hypothetical protein